MKNENPIKELIKGNLFQILGLIVVILNLWLFTSLAPINSNLSLVELRVNALEKLEPISSKQYMDVCARLDRIESKLDNYIFNNR